MKKNLLFYVLSIGAICLLVGVSFFKIYQKNHYTSTHSLEKVTLAEVAHTIFYAPMYVAYEKGFFEKENINLNIILSNGADKVSAAVLSGDADIGFSGSEATIYVYNGGEKDYLKTFAQLTQKDGSFIVSRKKISHFTLKDLIGHSIIGGRAGGMPEMTLEYALKQHNIDPQNDVSIDTSISFAAMGGAFIGGQGDFVTLFEPTASLIEEQGYGYVVASVGELGGIVPYTSFSARKSYIKKHPDIIQNFNKAIKKGLDYVHTHSDLEVAKVIQNQFPDSSLKQLEAAIYRYRSIEAWPVSTTFSRESFDHLQDIMIDYGEIDKKVAYDDLFYTIK